VLSVVVIFVVSIFSVVLVCGVVELDVIIFIVVVDVLFVNAEVVLGGTVSVKIGCMTVFSVEVDVLDIGVVVGEVVYSVVVLYSVVVVVV
jgi:hypothetical protein